MAVLHISESEAIRDIAALLAQVRAGTEVIIENENATVARLVPPTDAIEEREPGYDEWLKAEVEQALQNDPANRISEADAKAIMAERRRAILVKVQGSAA